MKHLSRDKKEHAGSEGKTNVRKSTNTGAVYGINKCGVMEIKRGKVIKGEELDVINEKMNALTLKRMKCTNVNVKCQVAYLKPIKWQE